jgi:hypothetical protein
LAQVLRTDYFVTDRQFLTCIASHPDAG